MQLNELTNPLKWDDPAWLRCHVELETYAVDKHCFSRTKEFAYRKGWEWTQTIRGLEYLGALRPTARALGVGAGREPLLFYFADRLRAVVGTDLYGRDAWAANEATGGMLSNPQAFCPRRFDAARLSFALMNGQQLACADRVFDFTWSLSSIEHFGSHAAARRAVQEMARVTKVGGHVVIATELVLTPDLDDHPEYFTRAAFETYVLDATPSLRPIQPMSYTLPPLEYLIDPIMVHLDGDVHRRRHHIILNDGHCQWTSVLCFLERCA